MTELAALVPHEAVLAATDREIAHVSNRLECWNLSVGWEGSTTSLSDAEPHRARAATVAGPSAPATSSWRSVPRWFCLKRPGARGRPESTKPLTQLGYYPDSWLHHGHVSFQMARGLFGCLPRSPSFYLFSLTVSVPGETPPRLWEVADSMAQP